METILCYLLFFEWATMIATLTNFLKIGIQFNIDFSIKVREQLKVKDHLVVDACQEYVPEFTANF